MAATAIVQAFSPTVKAQAAPAPGSTGDRGRHLLDGISPGLTTWQA
jgi:hypothetical protein